MERLFRPTSVAVIGGGTWCANVIGTCRRSGFGGAIHVVHPTKAEIAGVATVAQIADLPEPPDAVFVGVNREATVGVIRDLSAMGAGGAVCFASGFREASAELADGGDLQAALVEAAGDMPILGPNCYGLINALDGAALWPDQHGLGRVERGVALVTQSSNIALNLTMQRRGLPIAYVVTAGNQAQTGFAGIGEALLDDPRVTALGLHVEGFGDLRALEALPVKARALGKPIVALKAGASDQARAATVSHTASLAGSAAGAEALMARLGIGQVKSLAAMIETLKLCHVTGPLTSNRIASMSCSGGEASLMADSALGTGLEFPPLVPAQSEGLRAALGPRVALANPLDYHTYIWENLPAMTACFSAMMEGDLALGAVVLDFPREDRCDGKAWDPVIDAVAAAQVNSGRPVAIVASLPENLSEARAEAIMARGIAPLCGLDEALEAMAVAARIGAAGEAAPLLLPGGDREVSALSEADGKALLVGRGLDVPRGRRVATPGEAAEAAAEAGFPVVLKGEGAAHKTESGLVALNLADADAVRKTASAMDATGFLVEEMVTDTVAELLVGIVRDPAHGFVLTLGAGGTLAELWGDTVSLLVPASEAEVGEALDRLRIAPVIAGYRGRAGASKPAIVSAVMALQDAVTAHADRIAEIEINPLICTPARAVAADALVMMGEMP